MYSINYNYYFLISVNHFIINIMNAIDDSLLYFSVDGGWSELSEGTPCELASMNGSFECKCFKKTCTNPTPMNGGRDCIGESTHVQCIGKIHKYAIK